MSEFISNNAPLFLSILGIGCVLFLVTVGTIMEITDENRRDDTDE